MAPARILLTGAGGFVGGHLLPVLRAAFPAAELATPALDITEGAAVAAAVRALRPDACVHLAAIAAGGAARQNPRHAWEVNLHGTLALAEALRAEAPDCVLLFASSAEIYGTSFRAGRPLAEDAPAAPANPYAATKAAADLALGAMAQEGLRVVRARHFNHTGPGQSAAFVVPAFARQVARIAAGRQAAVIRTGALDPRRDFLDVRDVCAAYAAILAGADRIAPGTILNLASGVPRRIGDILDDLLRLAGVSATIETASALLRPTDTPLACGDAAAAHALLGWMPAIPWPTTLAEVLADWTARVAAGEE